MWLTDIITAYTLNTLILIRMGILIRGWLGMDNNLIIFIMGYVDNVLLIVGIYYTLASVETYLERYFENYKASPVVLASISGGLGNTFSDGVGFLVTGQIQWALFVMLGCLVGMLMVVPFMEWIKR
jgi:hypothetical protein